MIPGISFAQNLVNNPSFECGEDQCGAFQLQHIPEFFKYACEWSCPTSGTSDIYSTKLITKECFMSQPYSGIPHDHVGSQRPRSGNRFAGIYSYNAGLRLPTQYREYIQTKLKEKLVPGETYCAEMYLSLAELSKFANNNMGMRFNEGFVNEATLNPLPLLPQIVEKNIIKDTANWVKVGGRFVATTAADHLIIGNFFQDAETTGFTMTNSNALPYSYYFVDDVSVEQLPHSQFIISEDKIICKGSPTLLNASAGSNFITWTTLTDTSKIVNLGSKFEVKPDSTISYRVKTKGCGLSVVDTIKVTVITTPKVDLGADTTLCKGSNWKLDAGSGFNNYSWQGKVGGQYYTITQPGTYTVEVAYEYDCRSTDEITIKYKDIPKIDIGRDTIICAEFKTLNAGGDEYSYQWSDGSIATSFKPTHAGIYWVDATNQCGVIRDSIRIFSFDDLFFPNVVTQNKDEINEYFQIGVKDATGKIMTQIENYGYLQVFNRWGNEVFASSQYKNDWPNKQDDVPPETYYYMITYFDCRSYKGWIQLIR